METLSATDIIKLYREGRRDFAGASATQQDFTNSDLKGIIFRNAKLSFATFTGCQLQKSDFSGADLSWSDMDWANLTEAKFTGAKCIYINMDNATVDRADFRDVDFSWGRLLNVNFQAADTRGASWASAAFQLSEMTPESLSRVQAALGAHKGKISLEMEMRIKFLARSTIDKIMAMEMVSKEESVVPSGYRFNAGSNYRVAAETQGSIAVYSTGSMTDSYRTINPYRAEKKARSGPLF